MPKFRNRLDISIEKLTKDMLISISDKDVDQLEYEDLLGCVEELNYVISKICFSFLSSKPSYSKFSVLVGVLESVKQDFCTKANLLYDSNLKKI